MAEDLSPIVWSAEFSVGVGALDEQHQEIIRVINEMIASSDPSPHSEVISEALDRLTKFAKQHFQDEEAFLEKHGYPALAEQEENHRFFRRRTVELCRMAVQEESSTPTELLSFVRDWWIRHILDEDRRYGRELGLLSE